METSHINILRAWLNNYADGDRLYNVPTQELINLIDAIVRAELKMLEKKLT